MKLLAMIIFLPLFAHAQTVLEFEGAVENSSYQFELLRLRTVYHLCLNKTLPKAQRGHCVLAKLEKSETFGYHNNLDCRFEQHKVFVFFPRAKYKAKQKFHPSKAWIFDLKREKIYKLKPNSVNCVYGAGVPS